MMWQRVKLRRRLSSSDQSLKLQPLLPLLRIKMVKNQEADSLSARNSNKTQIQGKLLSSFLVSKSFNSCLHLPSWQWITSIGLQTITPRKTVPIHLHHLIKQSSKNKETMSNSFMSPILQEMSNLKLCLHSSYLETYLNQARL